MEASEREITNKEEETKSRRKANPVSIPPKRSPDPQSIEFSNAIETST
jgi:hypothetical protein